MPVHNTSGALPTNPITRQAMAEQRAVPINIAVMLESGILPKIPAFTGNMYTIAKNTITPAISSLLIVDPRSLTQNNLSIFCISFFMYISFVGCLLYHNTLQKTIDNGKLVTVLAKKEYQVILFFLYLCHFVISKQF